jgi:glucose/arabinose dehydrogenase
VARLRRPASLAGRILLALAGLAVLASVGAAGSCKLFLNCHLHGGGGGIQPISSLVLQGRGATSLAAGFHQSIVARGFTYPTDFAFLPGGRILVTEKNGLVRVVRNRHVLPRPFLDLRSRVATQFFRGVMAVQVDPDFEKNGYVYVLYVQRSGPGKATSPATVPRTSMRLIRVRAQGDRAVPGSEKVILGAAGGPSSCTSLPPTADCIPSDVDHDGGDIQFARDGTIYVSTGDGGGDDEHVEQTAVRAQNIDSLAGKVLHVRRDGKGLPSNPFWNGDASANRSKVWAYGVRNPFRLTLRPGSGVPYLGDVGSMVHEEIDAAVRGANLGWPCYEGHGRHGLYAGLQACKALFARGPTAVRVPVVSFPRKVSDSITGGVFYTGRRFPDQYRDAYFFGDWALSKLRVLRIDPAGSAVGRWVDFAERAAGPVKLAMGPDGSLYYLALNSGQIRRISYTGP